MNGVSIHLVVEDVAEALRWYPNALGASERRVLHLPDGSPALADLDISGTLVAVDARSRDRRWPRRRSPRRRPRPSSSLSRTHKRLCDVPRKRARPSSSPSKTPSGETGRCRSSTRGATDGRLTSTSGTYPTSKSSNTLRPSCRAATDDRLSIGVRWQAERHRAELFSPRDVHVTAIRQMRTFRSGPT
jgi:hypothetical protein